MSEKVVRLTQAERKVIIDALCYWETHLEDERDDRSLPPSHPLKRALTKMFEEARRG